MPEQITLYTAKICPFAHRVELALAESKVTDFTRFEISLTDKPDWYAPNVNPASKVPAIAYGGPRVPADQPSPASAKLAESLILVEFIGDLFPDSPILPKDPLQRARARFFIDVVSTKLLPAQFGVLNGRLPFTALYTVLEDIQALLPADKTYAVGNEYTVADIAIAPFLGRLELCLKHDAGAYEEGEGPKALEYITSSGRFARLVQYIEAITTRESFKTTFDEEYLKEKHAARFGPLRAQLAAGA
ncbi:glutathione S-transferase C-terminal-like protein [Mycena filopes]|nr:glutathione S-transferase C-terminal-like protein [Mycena filopes]